MGGVERAQRRRVRDQLAGEVGAPLQQAALCGRVWRQLAAGLGVRVDAGLESSWRCDAVDLRLPSCRDGMDGVRRPREMAGGWRPPAERMLPPLQTGSAWLRAETAHEDVFRRAGWQRWLWGHGQARRLSPVPIDTWHACRPCGAIRVGRGAVRRGGGWRRVATESTPPRAGAGGCTAKGFPHVSKAPPTDSTRPACICTRRARKIHVPRGLRGVTHAPTGVTVSAWGKMVPYASRSTRKLHLKAPHH